MTYVRDVMPQIGEWRSSWLNASLPGFWSRLFAPRGVGGEVLPLVQSPALSAAMTLVSCLTVVALASHVATRARSLRQQDWAFALMVVAMLLVAPLTWDHYFVQLLLPAVLCWMTPSPFRGYRTIVVGCLGALWVGPDWYWKVLIGTRWLDQVVAQPWQTLTALSFHSYALVAFFAVTAYASLTALRDGGLPDQERFRSDGLGGCPGVTRCGNVWVGAPSRSLRPDE